jgi:hypothetical protein
VKQTQRLQQQLLREASLRHIGPNELLDYLTLNGGPVSDLCEKFDDIPDCGLLRCIVWLQKSES